MTGEKFYVTTAIDYVNDLPHVGHAYEKIGADVLARYNRLMGNDTFFLIGNDEHSLNVERKAKELGMSPQQYTDGMTPKFLEIWKKLEISNNYFIRTSEQKHVKTVQEIFKRVYDKGDIYKGRYEGWYCRSCEAFLQEKDLVDGLCPNHQIEPEWIQEENYFFRLKNYSKPLSDYIDANPEFIEPQSRRNEIISLIGMGLEDISVSRSSVGWGIPVPFDNSQVVYVWIDALINYLSGVGYSDNSEQFKKYWPADVHIIGKDITRFHCVVWPALLMSAGIELPKTIWAHGWVNFGGKKLSKTHGRRVSIDEALEKYGSDALRYFLMREIPFDRDGDFTWEKFEERYNSDLANDLGNLLYRSLTMIEKYRDGRIPSPGKPQSKDNELQESLGKAMSSVGVSMSLMNFSQALSFIWEFIQRCNKYIEETAPWNLHKEEKKERLDTVLYNLSESLWFIAYCMIPPFMPHSARRILEQLGTEVDFDKISIKGIKDWGNLSPGTRIKKGEPLFPKIEK